SSHGQHPLGRCTAGNCCVVESECGYLLEHVGLIFPVQKIGECDSLSIGAVWEAFEDLNNVTNAFNRERPYHKPADETEDCRRYADSKSENENNNERESSVANDQAQCVASVLQKSVEGFPHINECQTSASVRGRGLFSSISLKPYSIARSAATNTLP